MKLILFWSFVTCFVTCFYHLVNAQCTTDELDRSTVAVLIENSLAAHSSNPAPLVFVHHYIIVCLSYGTSITDYNTTSLVVRYDCDNSSLCPNGMLIRRLITTKIPVFHLL